MSSYFGRWTSRFSAALALAAIAACAQTPPPDKGPPIGDMLSESAQRAAAAQETLALSQRSRVLPSGVRTSEVPPELAATRSVDWVGPIEQIGQNLAREAGYDFTRIGAPPAAPIIVDVRGENRPLVELMHSAGLQAKGRADLVVNPLTKTVKVVYAPR